MQQDEFAQASGDTSPDSPDRIQDFLTRHGGPGSSPRRAQKLESGVSGWYEVYAADGYRLRCDWSRFGSHEELKFAEIAPHAGGEGGPR